MRSGSIGSGSIISRGTPTTIRTRAMVRAGRCTAAALPRHTSRHRPGGCSCATQTDRDPLSGRRAPSLRGVHFDAGGCGRQQAEVHRRPVQLPPDRDRRGSEGCCSRLSASARIRIQRYYEAGSHPLQPWHPGPPGQQPIHGERHRVSVGNVRDLDLRLHAASFALLDPQTPFEDAFIKEQERRRQQRVRTQIYDITAWSLPYLFNVDASPRSPTRSAAVHSRAANRSAGYRQRRHGDSPASWPRGTAAGRFLASALREDIRVWSADDSFTISGRRYPSGTLIVKINDNAPTVHDRVARLANASGSDVVAITAPYGRMTDATACRSGRDVQAG